MTDQPNNVSRLEKIAKTMEAGHWLSSAKVVREAADEIERLRAERDALWRLTDRLFAEHDALRAERDEVRQSYCSLMEAYRGGDGRVTANKLGWDCFKGETP